MDTRKLILNISQRLVQEKGYNGFSLQAVADESKIRKASLFHHFPSKEDLIANVLSRYRHWFQSWNQKIINEEMTIWEKFDQFFEIYRYFRKEETLVCPLTMLSAEYVTLPDTVKDAIKELLNEIETWVEFQLENAKRKRELSKDLDSKQVAEHITSTINGSLSFSRIVSDEDRFERQLASILNQIKFYERVSA